MILDLHRQGLSVSAIARQVGVDRKTVRAYIAKGLEPPAYKKRPPAPSLVDGFEPYLRKRLAAYPILTARRLFREIKERGYCGGYSVVRDRMRDIRPARIAGYETRFDAIGGAPRTILYFRPHEDRGHRRGRRRARHLQPRPPRPRPPLRLSAARLPALSGQNEGQGRAAVPIHPRGLLPRRRVP